MNEVALSRAFRVGLFFAFGMILVWITYETLSESSLYSEHGYRVQASFDDLKELKTGGDVRMAGVGIGCIKELRLEGRKGVAVLIIEDQYHVPIDSTATIVSTGLLGNNHIVINVGTSKQFLSDGGTLETVKTPDLESLIARFEGVGQKLEKVFDGLDFGSQEGSGGPFGSVNKLVDDLRPKIETVLDNMVTVSTRLSTAQGTLGKLIANDDMHNELTTSLNSIKSAAHEAEKLFKDAQNFVASIDDESNQTSLLHVLLKDPASAEKFEKTIDNVHQFSEKLNSNNSSLGKLISDDQLYSQAKRTLNKVESAVEGIENSGPMTAVGITAGALF